MLSIHSLIKRYRGDTLALDDVSLEIGPGVTGLLGANGAGKTTLMSIIATVQKPTGGTVTWNGRDILSDPMQIRNDLGYLPQSFGVYEKLNAIEFLTYLGRLKGVPKSELKREIDELIDLVNLRPAAKRALRTYSGGMRQRVGIAQALLGNPSLLIVDEPTVGLDPEERLRFRNLLSRIAHDRVVILSTHIVSDVEAIAERIAIIREGKLLAYDLPEVLLQRTVGKVFTAIVPTDLLHDVQSRVAVSNITRRPDGTHVRYVGNAGDLPNATAVEPNLEDAYLHHQSGSLAAA